ncbi:MAG: hypothetical protein U0S36_10105 [Candidatus Nanopelagicales bacterium]
MLRPARTSRALATVAAGAAVSSVLLALPASAATAPTHLAAGTSVSASVRIVTPPTRVSRSALVRLMRNAGSTTDAALLSGAKLQNTVTVNGRTTSTFGRTRGGLSSVRDQNGVVTLTDYRSGRAWVPIADVVEALGVTPEQVAIALDSLGRPGATWAVITSGPGAATGTGSTETELVRQARAASTWTWKRAQGITTWRLAAPRSAMPSTMLVGLDRRQRVVRETLTTTVTSPVRSSARVTVLARYGRVSPIVLPTDAQSVGLTQLIAALESQPQGPGLRGIVGAAAAQIAALRAMSGR